MPAPGGHQDRRDRRPPDPRGAYADWTPQRFPADESQHGVRPRTTSPSSSTRRERPGRPKGVMLSNDNLFALLPMAGIGEMWRHQRVFGEPGGDAAFPHRRRRLGRCRACTRERPTVIFRDIDPVALIEDDRGGACHPRLPRAGGAAVHAGWCRGPTKADYSSLRHAGLRRLADQQGRARPSASRHVPAASSWRPSA